MMKYSPCPNCGVSLGFDLDDGKEVSCPNCSSLLPLMDEAEIKKLEDELKKEIERLIREFEAATNDSIIAIELCTYDGSIEIWR